MVGPVGESPIPGGIWNQATGGWMTPSDYTRYQQGAGGCSAAQPQGCVTQQQPQMTSQQFLAANPNPTPQQIADFDRSRGVISSTYASGGATYNLLDPVERRLASDPTAQVIFAGGQRLVASAGQMAEYAAGRTQGMFDLLAGAGIARFSAGAGGQTPTMGLGPLSVNVYSGGGNLKSSSTITPTGGMQSGSRLLDTIIQTAYPTALQAAQNMLPRQATATPTPTAQQPALSMFNPIDAAGKVVKTLYVPEGSYSQQQLENVKLGMSKSGELGIYERLGLNPSGAQRMAVNPDTGRLEPFVLIGGGGRAAAQSGMFGFAAATPAVYGRGQAQTGVAGLVTPRVMAPGVETSGLTGRDVLQIIAGGNTKNGYDIRDYLSRLGAEGYGGVVQRVDQRTLGGITYENVANRAPWNLARYLDPMAVNLGKSELPGARIPWSVGEQTAPVFFMDQYTKSGEAAPAITTIPQEIPGYFPAFGSAYPGGNVTGVTRAATAPLVIGGGGSSGRLVGSKTLASVATITPTGELPAPFVSSPQPAATEREFFGIKIPGFISGPISGLEKAESEVRKQLPSVSTVEKGEKLASLVSPFSAPFAIERVITGKESVGESLVGNVGQYKFFYEHPASAAVSFAAGFGLGKVGLAASKTAGLARAATAEKVISEGGIWRAAEQVGHAGSVAVPKVLAAAYAADVGIRSIEASGGSPTAAIQRGRAIATQEAFPMGQGYGLAYYGMQKPIISTTSKAGGVTLPKDTFGLVTETGELAIPGPVPEFGVQTSRGYNVPFRDMVAYTAKGELVLPAPENVKLVKPGELEMRYGSAVSTDISAPKAGERTDIPVIDLRENLALIGEATGPLSRPTVKGSVAKPTDVLKIAVAEQPSFGVRERLGYTTSYAKTQLEMAFPKTAFFAEYATSRTIPGIIKTTAGIPTGGAAARRPATPFDMSLYAEPVRAQRAAGGKGPQEVLTKEIVASRAEGARQSNAMFNIYRRTPMLVTSFAPRETATVSRQETRRVSAQTTQQVQEQRQGALEGLMPLGVATAVKTMTESERKRVRVPASLTDIEAGTSQRKHEAVLPLSIQETGPTTKERTLQIQKVTTQQDVTTRPKTVELQRTELFRELPRGRVTTGPVSFPLTGGGGGAGGGYRKGSRSYTETLGFEVSRGRKGAWTFGPQNTGTKFFRAMGKAGIASVNVPTSTRRKRRL